MYEYQNPTSRIDFIKFWELEMDNQKLIKELSTWNQQMSTLRKVKTRSIFYFMRSQMIGLTK
jgi:hypothetical protein